MSHYKVGLMHTVLQRLIQFPKLMNQFPASIRYNMDMDNMDFL